MDRRGMLSILGLGSVFAGASKITCSPIREIEPPDEFEYRGYRITWTGWKKGQDTADLKAQWLAYPKEGDHRLYVSNTGTWGLFFDGAHLNCSWTWVDRVSSIDQSAAGLASTCEQMREAIIRLIDDINEKGIGPDRLWEPPLTHPELKGYLGWRKLSPEHYAVWARDERIEQEGKTRIRYAVGFPRFGSRYV